MSELEHENLDESLYEEFLLYLQEEAERVKTDVEEEEEMEKCAAPVKLMNLQAP